MLELSPAEWTAVALSLRIALVATAWALPFGIAIGWLLARGNFWGKTVLDGLVHLPLVLPPVVTGYLLLLWFGRKGPIGAFLYDHLGVVFAYRWTGAGGVVMLEPAANWTPSYALAANADGSIVVGSGTHLTGPRGFRWTEATGCAR